MAFPELADAGRAAARDHPDCTVRPLADGTRVVSVPLEIPRGWNRASITARFVLPIAFPAAQPDCFYADLDLRLANGQMPANSGIQPLDSEMYVWFSWHLASWNPNRDSVGSYIRFIAGRLRDAR